MLVRNLQLGGVATIEPVAIKVSAGLMILAIIID